MVAQVMDNIKKECSSVEGKLSQRLRTFNFSNIKLRLKELLEKMEGMENRFDEAKETLKKVEKIEEMVQALLIGQEDLKKRVNVETNVLKRMSDKMRELQKKFNVVCDEVVKVEKYMRAMAIVVLPPQLRPLLGPKGPSQPS